ncbi:MAG: ATP-dependent DNA helicase [Candidatus Pacearchaeota archaeon]
MSENLRNNTHSVVNAPTGLGKTAAVLSVVLPFAIKNQLKVFFLTSRHTQHKIIIETLQQINKKNNTKITGISIIGKKWLCVQENVTLLRSRDFLEYCRALVADHQCVFFENFKKGERISSEAKISYKLLKEKICTIEEVFEEGKRVAICPYELSLLIAKNTTIIIGDYSYIFNPYVRETVFKKLDIKIDECIVVVDEAHNLPSRIKDLSSAFLTNIIIERAIKEARKFHPEALHVIKELGEILKNYSKLIKNQKIIENNKNEIWNRSFQKEQYITRENFVEKVQKIKDYDDLIIELNLISDAVRRAQRMSYIGSISNFLEQWKNGDEGFTRIVSLDTKGNDEIIALSYRCLDTSIITKKIFDECYHSILMSGTLNPTSMYKDLLGVKNANEKSFVSPFPKKNRLNIIVPSTSTKFMERNELQYIHISDICSKIVNIVPGNSVIFFPSYELMTKMSEMISRKTNKTIFFERSGMKKNEKEEFLENFKSYNKSGAVLLGVVSGSFSEGIDLPGDYLKCVIMVGLPLQKPNLETKALIEYYDKKFGKGWDYGYVIPAITRTIQGAGRCIRSETDRGAVIFLDMRYVFPIYRKLFPIDWDIDITLDYEKQLIKFFDKE